MATIQELAEARAKTAELVQALGMMNAAGRSIEETIAASARYRLAQDAFMKADADYRKAIEGMSSAELLALASKPSS